MWLNFYGSPQKYNGNQHPATNGRRSSNGLYDSFAQQIVQVYKTQVFVSVSHYQLGDVV